MFPVWWLALFVTLVIVVLWILGAASGSHHRRQLASSDWTSGWIGLIGQFVGLCLNLPGGQIRSDRLLCCLIWCCGRRLESILPHGANDTTIGVVTCQPENKPLWVLADRFVAHWKSQQGCGFQILDVNIFLQLASRDVASPTYDVL